MNKMNNNKSVSQATRRPSHKHDAFYMYCTLLYCTVQSTVCSPSLFISSSIITAFRIYLFASSTREAVVRSFVILLAFFFKNVCVNTDLPATIYVFRQLSAMQWPGRNAFQHSTAVEAVSKRRCASLPRTSGDESLWWIYLTESTVVHLKWSRLEMRSFLFHFTDRKGRNGCAFVSRRQMALFLVLKLALDGVHVSLFLPCFSILPCIFWPNLTKLDVRLFRCSDYRFVPKTSVNKWQTPSHMMPSIDCNFYLKLPIWVQTRRADHDYE